jgi:purine-cytosine permease-like protein
MLAVILAQIATLIPFLFGLATATIVAIKAPDYIAANNYVGGLLAVAPSWFFLPVCLIAVIGGMSTGTTSLYGTGLDMSSVFPRVLSRVKATLLIGVMSIAFIFIGRFAANLVQSVSTFAVLIITCTTPWMVIMIIGLLVRRGFCPDDLQVFTRGEPAAATGSATAGTGAAWVPGSRARRSACASSTCRGSSSARWATWPAASTSACRSRWAWRRWCT